MARDLTAEALARQSEAAQDLLRGLALDEDEEFVHDIVEGETGLLEAIDTALGEIDELELLIAGCAEKIKSYQERKSRLDARKDRVRAMIEQAMSRVDLGTVRLAGATLTVKAVPPKPIIRDEAAIPSEFWKMEPKLDRSALNSAAKDRQIPGVEMSNGGVSLQVRRK